jgi:hypothetical protein
MGFARALPIPPRSSPGVVSWLARRTGWQTSGAARWAAGRRAIAGGDGATRITGGDGAPRRRIGIAGAAMHGRGRCRDGGGEKDCGGQRDCCPARHFRISGLSCRGLAPNRLATAALSWLGNRWGWGPMTPSASGWVVQGEAIKFARPGCGFPEEHPYGLSCSAKAEHPVATASHGFRSIQTELSPTTGSSACADDDS